MILLLAGSNPKLTKQVNYLLRVSKDMCIIKRWKQKKIGLLAKSFGVCGCMLLIITGCAGESEQETAETGVEQVTAEIGEEQKALEDSDEQKSSETSDEQEISEQSAVQDAEEQQEVSLTITDNITNVADEISFSEERDVQEDSKADNKVTLIMVGDMLLHDRVEKSAQTDTGDYDYSAIFAHTKDLITEADLAIANEEVIIGGADLGVSGYPAFNAPFEFADQLVESGFDVICHGTNHALDKGGRGIMSCLTYWDNYPEIQVLGIHDSQEDQSKLTIIEKNGLKLAVLNYTYGTNGIELPADMPFGVDYLQEDAVIEDLSEAEEVADFTIVCPYWGTEYRLTPDSYQEKWTRIFVENGADLIIGTHPHVIEPVEWVEFGGNRALVYYSLGNFVNWTSGEGEGVSNRMVGLMANVTLAKQPSDKVEIEGYDAIPLVSHVESGFGNVTVYPLDAYSEALALENEIRNQAPDFNYGYICNLVSEVIHE